MTTVDLHAEVAAMSPARRDPVAMSWDDLRELSSADVDRDNEDLALWGRAVFEWGGHQYQLARASEPIPASLWLQMQVVGQGVVVGLSPALANALLQVDQLNLADISPGVLSLWVHRRLSARWPAHLPLLNATLRREDLGGDGRNWPLQSAWCAVMGMPAEATSLGLSIYSPDPCPATWLRQALEPWSIGQRQAALKHLSLQWPLVAARWTVDADMLTDLALGDVLLVN